MWASPAKPASSPLDKQVKDLLTNQKKIQKDIADLKKAKPNAKTDPAIKSLSDKHAKAMNAIEKSVKTL